MYDGIDRFNILCIPSKILPAVFTCLVYFVFSVNFVNVSLLIKWKCDDNHSFHKEME